jgi:hypothetical protein
MLTRGATSMLVHDKTMQLHCCNSVEQGVGVLVSSVSPDDVDQARIPLSRGRGAIAGFPFSSRPCSASDVEVKPKSSYSGNATTVRTSGCLHPACS